MECKHEIKLRDVTASDLSLFFDQTVGPRRKFMAAFTLEFEQFGKPEISYWIVCVCEERYGRGIYSKD